MIITYNDKTSAYSQWTIKTVKPGPVFEIIKGKNAPVEGAKVTVMQNGTVWDSSNFGINNIYFTLKDGTYRFFLPQGKYSLKVEKNGYITQFTAEKMYYGPINKAVMMVQGQNPAEIPPKNVIFRKLYLK